MYFVKPLVIVHNVRDVNFLGRVVHWDRSSFYFIVLGVAVIQILDRSLMKFSVLSQCILCH